MTNSDWYKQERSQVMFTHINSLAPGRCDGLFRCDLWYAPIVYIKPALSVKFSWLNTTKPFWWEVNIGSCNGLVLCHTMAITWTITDHVASRAHNGVALFYTCTLSDILWNCIHAHDVLLREIVNVYIELCYDENHMYFTAQGILI